MKKQIVVFTGAGVSKESGIDTFRDADGLWFQYKIEDVATPAGWKKNRERVLEFYNQRRAQLSSVHPNRAHDLIAEFEKWANVTVVTQNVDDLHERAGSTKIIHLHGELKKSRSTVNRNSIYDCEGDLKIGDKCEEGSQLRPHVIWFGEGLYQSDVDAAWKAARLADVCIIVGTSMQVSPANEIPFQTKETALIYYVDPNEQEFYVPEYREAFFTHHKMPATTGMQKVVNELKDIYGI